MTTYVNNLEKKLISHGLWKPLATDIANSVQQNFNTTTEFNNWIAAGNTTNGTPSQPVPVWINGLLYTHNGSTLTLFSGGDYKVDIRSFGAVADYDVSVTPTLSALNAATDNAAAIQAAVDYCLSIPGNTPSLYIPVIPNKAFKINSPIKIRRYINITSISRTGNTVSVQLSKSMSVTIGSTYYVTGTGTALDGVSLTATTTVNSSSITFTTSASGVIPNTLSGKIETSNDVSGFTIKSDNKHAFSLVPGRNINAMFDAGTTSGDINYFFYYLEFKDIGMLANPIHDGSIQANYCIYGTPLPHLRIGTARLQEAKISATNIGQAFSTIFDGVTASYGQNGFDFSGYGTAKGAANAILLNGVTVFANTGFGVITNDSYGLKINGGTFEANSAGSFYLGPLTRGFKADGVYHEEYQTMSGWNVGNSGYFVKAIYVFNGDPFGTIMYPSGAYTSSGSIEACRLGGSKYVKSLVWANNATDGLTIRNCSVSGELKYFASVSTNDTGDYTLFTVSGDVTGSMEIGGIVDIEVKDTAMTNSFGMINELTAVLKWETSVGGNTEYKLEFLGQSLNANILSAGSTVIRISQRPAILICEKPSTVSNSSSETRLSDGNGEIINRPLLDNVIVENNSGFSNIPIRIRKTMRYEIFVSAYRPNHVSTDTSLAYLAFDYTTFITAGDLLYCSDGKCLGKVVSCVADGTSPDGTHVSAYKLNVTKTNGTAGMNYSLGADVKKVKFWIEKDYGAREYDIAVTRIYVDKANQGNVAANKVLSSWVNVDTGYANTRWVASATKFPRLPTTPVYDLDLSIGTGPTSIYGFSILASDWPNLAGKEVSFSTWVKHGLNTDGVKLYVQNALGGGEYLETSEGINNDLTWRLKSLTFTWPTSGTLQFGIARIGAGVNTAVQVALPVVAELGADIRKIWALT